MGEKIIPDKVVIDFNDQVDELIDKLFEERDRLQIPTYIDSTVIDFIHDQANRMEVARRVFNHFAETGEVKIPD